jgi:hypothetical protein
MCFSDVFQVFQMHISIVSSIFRCMLQVLHLDILKVDWVLHILQYDPTCGNRLLLLGRHHGYSSAVRIRSQGQAGAVGALLSCWMGRGHGGCRSGQTSGH